MTFFLEVLLLVKHLPTWNPDSFVRLHHDGLWSLSAAKLVDTVQDGSSLKLLQFILRHTKFLDLLDRIWSRLASKLLLSFVMAVKWKTCRYHVQVLGPDISIQINLLDSSTRRNHPGICIYHLRYVQGTQSEESRELIDGYCARIAKRPAHIQMLFSLEHVVDTLACETRRTADPTPVFWLQYTGNIIRSHGRTVHQHYCPFCVCRA